MCILLIFIKSAFGEDIFMCRDYSSLPPELTLGDSYDASEDPEAEWDAFFEKPKDNKGQQWQPLSKDECEKKERELAYTSAKAAAEFFDSIYMPYISNGLFNIIGTAYEIDEYQQNLKRKHGFSFDFDVEDLEVNVKYERIY
jgi:hypothetical protein